MGPGPLALAIMIAMMNGMRSLAVSVFPSAEETAHVIHRNAHASVLIIFRWSVGLRTNICVSRTSHAMLLHYRGMCAVCVAVCAYMYADAARCVLLTAQHRVTFNPMAFFPVIRSPRRKNALFFLPSEFSDIPCAAGLFSDVK